LTSDNWQRYGLVAHRKTEFVGKTTVVFFRGKLAVFSKLVRKLRVRRFGGSGVIIAIVVAGSRVAVRGIRGLLTGGIV
jgi:hypothetical protein